MTDERRPTTDNVMRRCHACDEERSDVPELPKLPMCPRCAKAWRMGNRIGEECGAMAERGRRQGKKPRVVIESPLAGDVEKNLAYARRCALDSFRRGEAPFLSHLFYAGTALLDDTKDDERRLGMEAGFAWGAASDRAAVYIDLGLSRGMVEGIRRWHLAAIPLDVRALDREVRPLDRELVRAIAERAEVHELFRLAVASGGPAFALEPPTGDR